MRLLPYLNHSPAYSIAGEMSRALLVAAMWMRLPSYDIPEPLTYSLAGEMP
jgi:hypothetical protein